MPRAAAKPKDTKAPQAPFSQKLALLDWAVQLFGAGSLHELAKGMKGAELEGWDDENVSGFYRHLASVLPAKARVTHDMLRRYDENITAHTLQLREKRPEFVSWKYFQYLSLLFTELYLDRYFGGEDKLLAELNAHLDRFNERQGTAIRPYAADDLRKLAFWNATGSGKTLLMHVQMKQYLHYLRMHRREDELDRIVLLTPKEDLSKQHLREFALSGIHAELFEKDVAGLFDRHAVTIINIQRIREESGDKTVAVEAFEGNNLVLVDEGHRGSSGDEWKRMRDRLCERGFAFEYSATFGQAVSGKKELEQEYAKCILFDYSYKYFYNDGYGKDYRILNLGDDSDPSVRTLYMTACLLTFYEQLKLFRGEERAMREFRIEKPLWIFVGKTVSASAKKEKEQEVSDVLDILLFLAGFVRERNACVAMIRRLLGGSPGLTDGEGREIFRSSFTYLATLPLGPEEMYRDILRTVFNSASAEAMLHVCDLQGAEGEIALKLGDNEPFGVINVGDTGKLCGLCEAYPERMVVSSQPFSGSLFHRLDDRGSNIHLLIGSKKFTEGWSSWRVSTMGLMNVGRTEGAEMIQLFGRGVRLKGYGHSLKRSSHVEGVQPPPFIDVLETLTIFGIRADYMKQFRDYLEAEDIAGRESAKATVTLPVAKTYAQRGVELVTLDLKPGIDYKTQGPKPVLDVPDDGMELGEIAVDWYPKIDMTASRNRDLPAGAARDSGKLGPAHIAFLNMERLYFELQRYKNERRWFNLKLDLDKLSAILARTDWYTLYIPKEELAFDSYARVAQWEQIALALLKQYCERYYNYRRKEWEAPHTIYRPLSESDGNFTDEYRIAVDAGDTTLLAGLKKLRQSLESGDNAGFRFAGLDVFDFEPHLYRPLVYAGDGGGVRVTPVALNEGEYRFVRDLSDFCESDPAFFAENRLFLLRNRSRKGIGFFEAGGFYPDFILWLVTGERQIVAFVDPKGIKHHSITDKKLEFYRTIKEKEAQMGNPRVSLHSFIVSNTPHAQLTNSGTTLTIEQFNERNVLFQRDQAATYIGMMLRKMLNG
ncbi:DEAD/DEAH box helicase family protein [Paenibacillus sp. GYB003]|uniref:DEAD/DEAH box helicase family protein n=1 Tax=Paenibacillus sp. GYB003 TaxID=2994392 RepID=UPI002F964E0A